MGPLRSSIAAAIAAGNGDGDNDGAMDMSSTATVARFYEDEHFARGCHTAFLEGVAGAKAMATDVVLLIWLRTVMNRQFRHGGTMMDTMRLLYREGGVRRFYRGFSFAIIEAPLSRGVGAAANYATLHVLSRTGAAAHLPLAMQTAVSSLFVASFRLLYYPLDTAKTILQVEGSSGLSILRQKIRRYGIGVLYYGSSYAILGAAVRHTLWFTTYNYLTVHFASPSSEPLAKGNAHGTASDGDESQSVFGSDAVAAATGATALQQIWQNSLIGLACAVVTNTLANPLSVLKAFKQTHSENISYTRAFREIVGRHGFLHLIKRGLGTRLWVDAINSMLFTVAWRYFAPDH